jgi:RNA polymerase sigma-70 factor (ECF subfamily)
MPWLGTVARRIVIDDQRKRDARPGEVVAQEALEHHASPDDPVEAVLQTMLLTEAMRSLSPTHREVLVETLLWDRTTTQAAGVLGVPVGTVKSRVYYAVRALRLALREMS